MYNILPPDANQAIILAAVVSISLNPILYRQIGPVVKWLQKRGIDVYKRQAQRRTRNTCVRKNSLGGGKPVHDGVRCGCRG